MYENCEHQEIKIRYLSSQRLVLADWEIYHKPVTSRPVLWCQAEPRHHNTGDIRWGHGVHHVVHEPTLCPNMHRSLYKLLEQFSEQWLLVNVGPKTQAVAFACKHLSTGRGHRPSSAIPESTDRAEKAAKEPAIIPNISDIFKSSIKKS